jgi:hypothetical protein
MEIDLSSFLEDVEEVKSRFLKIYLTLLSIRRKTKAGEITDDLGNDIPMSFWIDYLVYSFGVTGCIAPSSIIPPNLVYDYPKLKSRFNTLIKTFGQVYMETNETRPPSAVERHLEVLFPTWLCDTENLLIRETDYRNIYEKVFEPYSSKPKVRPGYDDEEIQVKSYCGPKQSETKVYELYAKLRSLERIPLFLKTKKDYFPPEMGSAEETAPITSAGIINFPVRKSILAKALSKHYGPSNYLLEAFTSPEEATFPNYCSLYHQLDVYLGSKGSLGSFFNLDVRCPDEWNQVKFIFAEPPKSTPVITETVTMLQRNQHIPFILLIPDKRSANQVAVDEGKDGHNPDGRVYQITNKSFRKRREEDYKPYESLSGFVDLILVIGPDAFLKTDPSVRGIENNTLVIINDPDNFLGWKDQKKSPAEYPKKEELVRSLKSLFDIC